MPFDLSKIKKTPVELLLAGLRNESTQASTEAGLKLTQMAAEFGLGLRDFLTLAVDTRAGEHAARLQSSGLNGYEASLDFLNLPFATNLEQGVLLQAASDTFQVYPGTRALFPEVIDDMLRFVNRQDLIESTAGIVGNSRTISGTELISTVVADDSAERGTFVVPELANIPVRSIRTSQSSVSMFKHGSAIRTSYEFNRRASLDILTPHAARIARQLEISKVTSATNILINGDGVNGAAAAVALSTHGADFSGGKTLKDNYRALAKFLMFRAKAGNPVDTIIGNFDSFVELMFMFMPTTTNVKSDAVEGAALGGPAMQLPIMGGTVKFEFSSAVPANRLICFSRADTLEELVEAGASIAENERSIRNQSVTYVRTEVTGYKLVYGDTRTNLTINA